MNAPLGRRTVLALIGAAALAPRLAGASTLDARAAVLARGFNLPDQVPARPSQRPDRTTLKWLRVRGMTHVRLPVRGEALMSRFSNPATIRAAIDDFNRAMDLLLGLDFAVSADMHPGDDFGHLHRADPDAALAALTEGWRHLARPIRRLPATRVFAELLNEPQTTDAIWRAQAERLAADLRADLPATTFIAGPAPYQRVEALAAWRPLDDKNIVYAFHYYDPMAFTHQGLTWNAADPLSRLEGVPFPTSRADPAMARLLEGLRARGEADLAASIDRALDQPWTKETIAAQFAPLADWSRTHDAPVILNEFGVLRFKAARAARLEWLKSVRETAQAHQFGWAHWDYNQGFGLLDEAGQPDRPLIDALLPT
ncbi:glycoside hydrolase family 5 protein [Methylocapsa sp. S129]|uniref:glycoside hydrolase family 5 protein n=1 Tax=Methylocapsa sp. S129 TaxID=1641869 RepID=UPI00131C091C|nr:cellulase family glycosylhydrolase [Methylocapsa sp. S129]